MGKAALYRRWPSKQAMLVRVMERDSTVLTNVSRITVAWAVVFAIVHAYWAGGGEAGTNGDPADSVGAQIYIGAITLVGFLGAWVAYGAPASRPRTRLARAGGAALLLGVAFGAGRWIAAWSLDGDGASGVVTSLYFLLGGLLFSVLGWRRGRTHLLRTA